MRLQDRRVHENVGVSRTAFAEERRAWEEAQAAEEEVSPTVGFLFSSAEISPSASPRMSPQYHQRQAAATCAASGVRSAISPLDLAFAKGQSQSIARGLRRGDPAAEQQLGTLCVQARA